VAQLVVILDVFVAERNADHALPDQLRQAVLHLLRTAMIDEAAGQPLDQPDRPVGLAQQQGPRVRGDRPAVEGGHHLAAVESFKLEPIWTTLWLHRTPFPNLLSL
jgi:hypothetical protein